MIEYHTLKNLVDQEMSITQIASSLSCSKGQVRHWLNKFSLKTIKKLSQRHFENKYCHRCKETKPLSDFYTRRKGTEPSVYCKSCSSLQTKERQWEVKRSAVEYKGGKCVVCDYDAYIGALEFHHIDPKEKDYTIAHKKLYSFEKIKNELDKCILLCSNCHREVHAGLHDDIIWRATRDSNSH